jgi:hypothetical protein
MCLVLAALNHQVDDQYMALGPSPVVASGSVGVTGVPTVVGCGVNTTVVPGAGSTGGVAATSGGVVVVAVLGSPKMG